MSDGIVLFYYTPEDQPVVTEEQQAKIAAEPMVASFPGVPLRDLVESDLESIPWWIVRSLDASPLYQATSDGVHWLADHNPDALQPRELAPEEMLQEGETPPGLTGTPIALPDQADKEE